MGIRSGDDGEVVGGARVSVTDRLLGRGGVQEPTYPSRLTVPGGSGGGRVLGAFVTSIAIMSPPTLRTSETRSASPLELFFDLAYVLVIAELASDLLHHLDWAGVGQFAAFFTVIWFSWLGFTLYTNRFDTNDVVFRVAKLAATAAIAGCAASAFAATDRLFLAFGGSYLLARVILALLYVRAWRHVHEARRTVTVYLVAASITAVLWAVSLALPEPARYVLWGAVIAVDTLAPVLATRRGDLAPLHLEHLPERFNLLVILVLGEVVGAVVTGEHDTGWARIPLLLGIGGFVIAAGLWWSYFDVGSAIGQRELTKAEEVEERTEEGPPDQEGHTGRRLDWFVYGHLPLTAGITVAGVGLEDLVVHPDTQGPSAAGCALALDLAGFWFGLALVVGGTEQNWRRALRWPGSFLPVPLVLALLPLPAGALVLALVVVTVAAAAVGTVLLRGRS